MFVVKAGGKKEEFDEGKIIGTCLRSGVSEKAAMEIAEKIKSSIHPGMTTHDIYRKILEELDKREDRSSLLFRLREAVAKLDSISFEMYVQRILEADGFTCEWNVKIQGMYVEHQIDIIAQRRLADGRQEMMLVECKRHINPHRYTGLNIPLQVQARLEDVEDGYKLRKNPYKFTGAWIVTNGKFSEHAKNYAHGKAMRLTGWKYDGQYSLEHLIHTRNMFPVTLLDTGQALLRKGLITMHDLLETGDESLKVQARKVLHV